MDGRIRLLIGKLTNAMDGRTDGRTERLTDQPMDGRTVRLIELRESISKAKINEGKSDLD